MRGAAWRGTFECADLFAVGTVCPEPQRAAVAHVLDQLARVVTQPLCSAGPVGGCRQTPVRSAARALMWISQNSSLGPELSENGCHSMKLTEGKLMNMYFARPESAVGGKPSGGVGRGGARATVHRTCAMPKMLQSRPILSPRYRASLRNAVSAHIAVAAAPTADRWMGCLRNLTRRQSPWSTFTSMARCPFAHGQDNAKDDSCTAGGGERACG